MNPLANILLRMPTPFEIGVASTVDMALKYSLLAGGVWLLCFSLFRHQWFHRKIVQKMPPSMEVRREIAYSMLSLMIFGAVGAVTFTAALHGFTRIYWRFSDYGGLWFGLSIAATIVLHDTWFYWTHRLMHHRKLFRIFHRVHHLSHNPSPWAAYAFDPAEAVVQAAIFPLAALLMPLHPLAFMIFMLWQIGYNVAGHAGYEFHPRWLMETWLGKVMNTPTNHAMHHEKMRGNYGLYFNVWDRLMGTNHRDYEDRFREVTTRPAAPREIRSDAPSLP